jgi:glycolate oxidase subunit GlcD
MKNLLSKLFASPSEQPLALPKRNPLDDEEDFSPVGSSLDQELQAFLDKKQDLLENRQDKGRQFDPKAFERGLVDRVGKRYVLTQPEELMAYECDACLMVSARPEWVVLPATTEEVSEVVQWCVQHEIPFVPRGGGTGLSGGALPVQGGVIIGLNRMNRILSVDVDAKTAVVEVGVVNAKLNELLAPSGLFYAPDPSSQGACTLGGNIAENAGGIHCIKYGVTVDHILALEVVLPNGKVTWIGTETRRHQGMNLVGLMVGSEGTLGVVTRAVVRLVTKPKSVRVYLAAFDTVAEATGAASQIIASGILPSALEFMDAFTVKAVNEAFDVGFPPNSAAVLLIELDSPVPDGLALLEKQLLSVVHQFSPSLVRTAESEAERLKLWAARKGAVAAYGRILPAFYLHDCVIPRSKLTEVLSKIEALSTEYDMTVGNVFHAGDGNLHPNILFDPADEAMLKRVMVGGEEILKVCLSVGGTLSGEHGIGIEKSQYMRYLFTEFEIQQMRALKRVFDPANLANPGKILPSRGGCGEAHSAQPDKLKALLAQHEGIWI